MRRYLAVPLALLFIALGVPSNAQNAGDEARVSVDEGAPLTVECALRVEERAEWRLDGGAVPADLRPAGEAAAGGRLTARLHAPAAHPHHAGVYTCSRQPDQRIRVHVRPAPLRALPDAAEPTTLAAPAAAPDAPIVADSPLTVQYYIVGTVFALNCTTTRPADAGSYVWTKNGTAVEKVSDLRDRYKLEEGGAVFRMAVRTNEDDFGNYSCAVGGAPVLSWEVRGRPVAKMPQNANVVEKQSLKLTCKVLGKPYPPVAWTVSNSSEENGTDVKAVLGDRVKLQRSEQGVENGELVLSAAERTDAGVYTCTPLGVPDALPFSTTLRVKDQYAALWPFLGICAEVFVLCAIILVYEKRRTKPELDDSDTDNHDQKKS